MISPARLRPRLLATLPATFIVGCGTATAVYKMYDGPEQLPGDVASVNMSDPNVSIVTITGKRVDAADYGRVTLAPGSYAVTVECLFGASVTVASGGLIRDSESFDVLFQAGHAYSPRCERSYGLGFRTYIWMSDDTVDMAAAGQRKP